MNIIKEVFEHFIKQKKKERLRKKGINDRLTKDRIIWDIRTLFEQ